MIGLRPVILWMGVILFVVLGVSIGLSVAAAMVAHGSSAFSAVAMGACAGGYGAWLALLRNPRCCRATSDVDDGKAVGANS